MCNNFLALIIYLMNIYTVSTVQLNRSRKICRFWTIFNKNINFKGIYLQKFKKLWTIKKGAVGRKHTQPLYINRKAPKNIENIIYIKFINSQSTFMWQSSLFYQVANLFFTWKNSALYLNLHGVLLNMRYVTLQLFSYAYHDLNNLLPIYSSLTSFKFLGNLKINSKIQFITDIFSVVVKYSKAFGSLAKIISNNQYTGTFLIQLPSKLKKIFFITTRVLMHLELILKKNSKPASSKAGFWHNKGFRPKVRGVAMNPVDHPHGGRTKSIKLQRTPWGFVTKYK